MFDVFYLGENPKLVEQLPFAKSVTDADQISSNTKMYWLVEANIEVIDISVFDYRPPNYDQVFHHVWKYSGNSQGGVHLIPRIAARGVKLVDRQVCLHTVRFSVHLVSDPTDITQAIPESWMIDSEYQIEPDIYWTPDYFERNMIHVFQVKDQLTHKYPDSMGGVYWYPADPASAQIKIHTEPLDIQLKKYPVHLVSDPTDAMQAIPESWMIDSEYAISDVTSIGIPWIPSSFERHMIHVFHIKNLRDKYMSDMGGVYWYPADPASAQIKIHTDPLDIPLKRYPVHLVSDPTDITQAIPESWMVDSEYQIETDITWVPSSFERDMIHVFQVKDQLNHKYPDSMGGVYWYPADPASAQIKIHTDPLTFYRRDNTLYESEEQGRSQTVSEWFWVVDPEVEPLPNFDFNFVPATWDTGKTHVWQKLNPKTKRQYDYAGVMLCPKTPQTQGRPKYIREAACVQREYPVCYLTPADYTKPLEQAYRRFSELCDTGMYWVVDAYTQLEPDFDFDYYPTQWDQKCVHVFQNSDGDYKNVRLVPKHTFLENTYTDDQIANNSFSDLKLINTTASTKPEWPVLNLPSVDRNQFINAIKDIDSAFVWTVDPDVKVDHAVLASGFTPNITNIHKVHTWQKTNAVTGHTHSYGGLRLWPTNIDHNQITTDALRLNRFKNMQYVRSSGSFNKLYDIVFISYHEPQAAEMYNQLQDHLNNVTTVSGDRFNLIWVKDVQGIFQAHKQAAAQVNTDMFWVVDADAQVLPDFKFDYVADVYDLGVTHVWNSLNPVTGLEYGYGGIKLLPKSLVMSVSDWGLDFTTGLSTRLKVMAEPSCVTQFNTDEFSTWRSAFRESVKLTLKDDADSKHRLEAWLHPITTASFSDQAKLGAEQGRQFAIQHRHQPDQVNNINNFEWLKKQYHNA